MLTREPMRYVIELTRTRDDRVEGVVIRDGLGHAVGFSGWSELMSLLEPPPLGTADCEQQTVTPPHLEAF
jgi:hypothetical protein